MLFNLKNKKNNSFQIKPAVFAGFTPFDPLKLSSYQAGYLMNRTTDLPAGSINPVGPQWWDAILLSAVSKFIQAPANITTQIINGFNCVVLDGINTRLMNFPFDVFTNAFTDFSILIGFKKNAAISNYSMVMAQNNAAEDERLYVGFTPTDLIQVQLANAAGANAINCLSVQTYDDQLPHAWIATFDQTNKTCRLVIHTGENISSSNPLYVSKNLAGNSSGDFKLGEWNFAPPYSAQPGCYGDVLIFNEVLNDAKINLLLSWECSRLNIAHTPI